MKPILYSILLLFVQNISFAQNGCDGQRYAQAVFTNVDTTKAVKFGENTTIGGNFKELFMDIYEPEGDSIAARPVVMIAFGGSYITGNRQQVSNLCYRYAKQGFVAVAIDYRTYDGPIFPVPDSSDFVDVAVKATGDYKAAVRKLREDAANGNPFRIDPDLIFAGGVSSGAITALHLAYGDSTDALPPFFFNAVANNGGFEGNSSTNYQYSSEVQGVLNFSGALVRAAIIDANDPPLFSVHDSGDGTVPYNKDYAKFNFGFFTVDVIYVEGSLPMSHEATAKGVNNSLITVPSNNHVSYFNNSPWQDSVLNSSYRFLQTLVCGSPVATSQLSSPTINAFPNPSFGDIVLQMSEMPGNYSLFIHDAMGRQVYSQKALNENTLLIPRATLPAGVYVLSVQFEDTELPLVQKRIVFR